MICLLNPNLVFNDEPKDGAILKITESLKWITVGAHAQNALKIK